MPRAKIKKGDTVMVIAGRERGKTGKVLRVMPRESRAIVERLNMVKRHRRGRGVQSPGGIIEQEAALHISNLMILCDKCNAPVRAGRKLFEDGRKVRVCRRCGEMLDT